MLRGPLFISVYQMKNFLFTLLLFFCYCTTFAQLEKPITWSYVAKKTNNNEATVFIKAKLTGKWHVYAQEVQSDAMRLKFTYAPSADFTLIGKTIAPKPVEKYDQTVKMELAYFEKEVVFTQKIKLKKALANVKVKIEFMVCNDKSCLPADEIMLNIPIK